MAVTEGLQYLELRQRLKETFRKKMHEETGYALSKPPEKNVRLPYDENYGCFFGPSQPAIARRVAQERKKLLQYLEQNDSIFQDNHSPPVKGSKKFKVTIDRKAKIQRLKESRDYSFLLSDEREAPVPKKEIASYGNCLIRLKPFQVGNGTSKKPAERNLEQKRPLREPCKPKIMQEQPVASSKPQMKKPAVKQNPSQASTQDPNKKRKQISSYEDDHYEGEMALRIIRKMFNTKRFVGRDDADINMETTYEQINKEEKRSERLARKEDQAQLRLIEEEERRERMRKLKIKKRKLHQQ